MQRVASTNRNAEVIEYYDSMPHKLVRFEVGKKEPQGMKILKVSNPSPGVSGGRTPPVEDSVRDAGNVMSRTSTQRAAEEGLESGKR